MTTSTFHMTGQRLDGLVVSGHSGYGEEGGDIVCAAVSAAVGLVECTVNDVLGLQAPVKVRREGAVVSLKLPGGLNELSEYACQNLLAGALVYLEGLAEQYPENLVVLMDDDEEDGRSTSS